MNEVHLLSGDTTTSTVVTLRPTMCSECLLPLELVEWLLEFVSTQDIIRFSHTCHYWRVLSETAPQWNSLHQDMIPVSRSLLRKAPRSIATRDQFYESAKAREISVRTRERTEGFAYWGHCPISALMVGLYVAAAYGATGFGYIVAHQGSDAKIGSDIFFLTLVGAPVVFLFGGQFLGFVIVRLHRMCARDLHRGALRNTRDFFRTSIKENDTVLYLLAWLHLLICCVTLSLLGARLHAIDSIQDFFNVTSPFFYNANATVSLPSSWYAFSSGNLTGVSSTLEWTFNETGEFRVLADTVGGYYLSGGLDTIAHGIIDLDHPRSYFTDRRTALSTQILIWFGSTFGVVLCFLGAQVFWRNVSTRNKFNLFAILSVVCVFGSAILSMVVMGAMCVADLPFCALDKGGSIAVLVAGSMLTLCVGQGLRRWCHYRLEKVSSSIHGCSLLAWMAGVYFASTISGR